MREDEARSMKRTHHMMCNAAKYEYARFKNACRLIRRGSVKRAGTTISTILLTLNNRHKKLFCSNFFFLRVPCICCLATSAQQNEYACQSLYCFNGIGLLCCCYRGSARHHRCHRRRTRNAMHSDSLEHIVNATHRFSNDHL